MSQRWCLLFPLLVLLAHPFQTFALRALSEDVGAAAPRGSERTPAEQGRLGASGAPAPLAPRIETMSAVIVSRNDNRYIKRTLDSIYKTTPKGVLKEVIVLDDASDPPLADELKGYPQIRLLRHEEGRGLTKSKNEAANLATADMIMFFDAHVKPEPNWWRPILRHLNTNYKRVVMPTIGDLDGDTWERKRKKAGVKMLFDWNLGFQWYDDGDDLVPVMLGGIFGITRRWWLESGEYDDGMMLWGGENVEFSVRMWLCGGEIYVARDSCVSHLFRSVEERPYFRNHTVEKINYVRAVEVWFGEYREHFYRARPSARELVSAAGDLSDRLALKARLQCKPFEWYIKKFKKAFARKGMIPESVFLLRDRKTGRCLSVARNQSGVTEGECGPEKRYQQWVERGSGRGLRSAKHPSLCLAANASAVHKEGSKVLLSQCAAHTEEQDWKLRGGHLRWRSSCIRGSEEGFLTLKNCPASLRDSGNFEMYARHAVAPCHGHTAGC